ncbi:MAG: hypothetical protein JW982_12045 [Spirochaetes bacterium]|nr:hypothetical protein [Spirochaetota bacterium]
MNLVELRQNAVADGRAMIAVIYRDTKEFSTAAVCPACWNDRSRRFTLLKHMEKLNVQVISKEDKIDGVYLKGKKHILTCKYNDEIDPWLKFKIQNSRKRLF